MSDAAAEAAFTGVTFEVTLDEGFIGFMVRHMIDEALLNENGAYAIGFKNTLELTVLIEGHPPIDEGLLRLAQELARPAISSLELFSPAVSKVMAVPVRATRSFAPTLAGMRNMRSDLDSSRIDLTDEYLQTELKEL